MLKVLAIGLSITIMTGVQLSAQRSLGRTCIRLTYDSLRSGADSLVFPQRLELGRGRRQGSIRVLDSLHSSPRRDARARWGAIPDSSNQYLLALTFQKAWLVYILHLR